METLLKEPETKTPSAETEKSQEQTPDQFQKSLEIFNRYERVSREEAQQPEFMMCFDAHEQELAAGLYGALEEFVAQAAEKGEAVTIAGMFDRLDAAIREQAKSVDEETLDDLYLVATKMRYNLQVRHDHGQRDHDTFGVKSSNRLYDFVGHDPFRNPDEEDIQAQADYVFHQIAKRYNRRVEPEESASAPDTLPKNPTQPA